MPITEAISSVATLLSKVFGFVVDPDGLAAMKLEHRIEVIHAGIKIAIQQKDVAAIDSLFNQYRELQNKLP